MAASPPTVKRAVIPQEYLGFENGYDVTLLELTAPAGVAPVPISGPQQTSLWAPGTLETIAGFGVTKENGDAPDVLQVAQVPTISDAACATPGVELLGADDALRGVPAGRRRHLPGRLRRTDLRPHGRR